MPMVIRPHGKESVDSDIVSISLSADGGFVAWSTYNGLFAIMSLETKEKKVTNL